MVHRVLVAIDGSPASKSALEIACALADNYEAALGLLTVTAPGEISDDQISAAKLEGLLPEDRSYLSVYDAYSSSSVELESRRAEKATLLSALLAESIVAQARAYSGDKPFQAIKTFVSSGDPADAILDCAERNAADIIIMGHDQQGLVESLFKGSVANEVQNKAKCPVLVYSKPKD